jgi:hypothetical protein
MTMPAFRRFLHALSLLFLLVAASSQVSAGGSIGSRNFGNVELGRTVGGVFLTLTNRTGATQSISVAVTGPAAGDFPSSASRTSVPPNEKVDYSILFTPSQLGLRTALVTFKTSDGRVDTTDVQGTGVPPRIVCPANITVSNDPNQCGAVVNYPAPTAVGAAGAITCVPPSGSTFPLGTTTVHCTSASGATCSFTVTVNDTQPPTITCPANLTVNAVPGQCTAAVTLPRPTPTDNCGGGGTQTFQFSTPLSRNVTIRLPYDFSSGSSNDTVIVSFPKGVTPITYTATDAAGNQSHCSFTITVNDTQPPTITCPANLTVSTDPGQCDAVVNYPAPAASDNCPGVTVACNPPSGFHFPLGQTTVTCTATDTSGNTASCAFKVTVKDTEPPTITCPPSLLLPQDPGTRSGTFVPTPAQAQDNCPGVTVTGTRSDGFPITDHTYPVGATVLTWTATDASGNQATCTQEIGVHDSRIVGVVGLDTNGNHLPDPPQEPRLKGVTIELRDPVADEQWARHPALEKPAPLATTQTNEVGNFSFPVAPPGVYDVVVKLAPGQTISALFPGPSNQAQIVTVNGEQRLRVTMQAGDTVAGLGILLQ